MKNDKVLRFIPDNDVILHYTGRRTEVPHSVARKAIEMRILKRSNKECKCCHVRPGVSRWLLCTRDDERSTKKYFSVKICDTCYNEEVEKLFGGSYFNSEASFKANLLFVHLRNRSKGYLNFADTTTQRAGYQVDLAAVEPDIRKPGILGGVIYGYSNQKGCFYRASGKEVLYFEVKDGKEVPITLEQG